jgi:diguanylate cyclase (GGDEF)-like protein
MERDKTPERPPMDLDSQQWSKLQQVTRAIARGDPPRTVLTQVLSLAADLAAGTGCIQLVTEKQFEAILSDSELNVGEVELGEKARLVWEGPLADELRQLPRGTEPELAADGKRLVLPLGSGTVVVLDPEQPVLTDPNRLVSLKILADLAAGAARSASELAQAQAQSKRLENISQMLYQQNAMLQELAVVDELTGLYNRRFFERRLSYEFERFNRYAFPLSLVLFDIDHFKQVNDTFGHHAGDAVLRHVANIGREKIRKVDLLARHGGDEFALMLPHTLVEGALALSQRLCDGVAEGPAYVGELMITVTVSAGIASIQKGLKGDAASVFRSADQALYQAKASGRNQVVVATDLE